MVSTVRDPSYIYFVSAGMQGSIADARLNCRNLRLIEHSMCCFNNATDLGQGSFFMLLPNEDHATRLEFSNFPGPFVTHGFDVVTSPTNDEDLFFLAVNHLPNPLASLSETHPDIPKARSQIELFSYTIGDQRVRHLRSIQSPLIRTPNDIFAVSETSFYVTNDHFAREGFQRTLEDWGHENWGALSDLIHVAISPTAVESEDPSAGITATIAMDELQNPNGLGHGRHAGEIVLVRAASGILSILGPGEKGGGKLEVKDQVQLPSSLDNPVYFHDPYAVETGRDASGYVLAGLAHSMSFPHPAKNPIVVWLLQPPGSGEREEVEVMRGKPLGEWTQKSIFEDDGARVNTASTAVLVAIPPGKNRGRKQAWLLVSGPVAVGVYKTKVDL